jgi:DNA-binding GntR family transcriptional regulator
MAVGTYVRQPLRADMVRDGLRQAILGGEFPPGAKLPNENLLCVRFAVSRTTVREAVRGLAAEGFVVRRQGSGTFVTSRPPLRNALEANFTYTEIIESVGMRAGQRRLALRAMLADESVAALLDLGRHASVVRLERVRTADDRPAIYSIDYLPSTVMTPELLAPDPEQSIYQLLATLGLPVVHGEATLTPVLADPHLARILEVKVGEPLQRLVQIDFASDGRRVLLSFEWVVPSIVEFRVHRRGPHQDVPTLVET